MTIEINGNFHALARTLRAATVRVHDDKRSGSGSGIVWNSDGTIVTNAHVVRGSSALIEWEDGRRARAQLVRRDEERDLAALRIESAAGLSAASIRSSATLLPGELVVAVGNPLGLTGALTTGLVQRSNARWVVADVRLAPGNSGGPLADTTGRVVGVNSMVAGSLALAVPSDAVTDFLGLPASRGRIGITAAPVMVARAGKREPALLVTAVEAGSRAHAAGLELGDTIVATNQGHASDLARFAASLAHATTFDIVRGGTQLTLTAPSAGEGARAA